MWRARIWIAALACATVSLCGCDWLVPPPDAKAVAAAQDAVYAAVVRDMVPPTHTRSRVSELVFSKSVWTGATASGDVRECEKRSGAYVPLSPPPYNTLADKIYRLINRDHYDDFVRADTVESFLHGYCTEGPLSESFHTDLPRHFIGPDAKIYMMDTLPIKGKGWRSLKDLFPGASGVISLSHVGFDRQLDQAIVFAAFNCGLLCATGWTYALAKVHGRWKVIGKRVVWVS